LEVATMAGKVAESAAQNLHTASVVGMSVDTRPTRLATAATPLKVTLSGTVLVDFDVTVVDADGTANHVVVRVEFPDEVRSMLESSTWVRGMSIHDVVSRLGANFLLHYGSWVTRLASRESSSRLKPPTFHLPLSYVRSNLAAVCASVA
jgi:hypothetical protein